MSDKKKRPDYVKLPLNSSQHRELGFRRALKHAGYLPQSIEVAVRKHRTWLKDGTGDE